MLRHKEGMLTELIIHELTHGTLYVKSDVTFNENLASFIGEKGALEFIGKKFGTDSKEMTDYLHEKSDERLFRALALTYYKRLDSLYVNTRDIKELPDLKRKMIYDFINAAQRSSLHSPRYRLYSKKAAITGNAFFLGFERYDSKLGEFEKDLRENYQGDLRKYLQGLIKIYGK
jgi:predicted aminopeptidase